MTKTRMPKSSKIKKTKTANNPQPGAPKNSSLKSMAQKNPFVAPHAEEPSLEFLHEFVKEKLPDPIWNRELLVKRGKLPKGAEKPHISEYILSAVNHYEFQQSCRDGFLYLLQKMQAKTPAAGVTGKRQSALEGLLTEATEVFVPSDTDFTLNDYRTAARFIYCDRSPPSDKGLRRQFSNERQWTMVLSVNRDQPLAAFIREMEKTLIPEFRKQLLQVAMSDIHDAALDRDEFSKSHEVQGKDFDFRKVLKKIKSADSAKRRGRQDYGQKALQKRLFSLACYRYAQAGYGYTAYNNAIKRLNCIGIYDTEMKEGTFKNRVWGVTEMLADNWWSYGVTDLRSEVLAGRISFPEITKGMLMQKLTK